MPILTASSRARRSARAATARVGAGRRGVACLAAVVVVVGLASCSLGGGDESAGPAPTATAPASVASPPARPAATPAARIAASPPPRPERTRPVGPPVIPTPGATPTSFRTETAEIGPVVWTTEIDPVTKAPRDRVEAFPADARALYAALPVARLAAGSELVATWSYNGTPLDGFESRIRAERDERDLWVEFHIERTGAERWPLGTYAVEVTVDGRLAQGAAVVVDPVAPS